MHWVENKLAKIKIKIKSMFHSINSVIKPEVSICILSHGGMKIKAPRICMSTIEQETQRETCLPYSMWNIKEIFFPSSQDTEEIDEENINITSSTLRDITTYNITYAFIDLPYIPSYLLEYQGEEIEYKTLHFSIEALIVPRKFTLWFSNVFRYVGISTSSNIDYRRERHRMLVNDIISGKHVCMSNYEKNKDNNLGRNMNDQHRFVQKRTETVDETYDRIKCNPMIYKQIIDKNYVTSSSTYHIITMVYKKKEYILLNGTYIGNMQCKNQLISVFKTKNQRKTIEMFYEDMHKTETTAKEIIDLMDVLFPFGANLKWYDTSCNYIENLETYETTSKVPHKLKDIYTEVIRRSLAIINKALNRIPSIAYGKKSKRKSKHKSKRKTKRERSL